MASEIRVNQIQNRSGLTTTTFTDTGVTISGILTVSDDLNVGGVLTYEDVTNIDSVGIVTARAGINLVGNDLNVGSNIKIGNASGIVTATSFSGSGANLTGIDTDLVSDTSPQLGGNLDVNTKNIVFGDSGGATDDRLTFGAGTDLSIYHNGNESKIEETGTGGLRINTSVLMINNGDQSETMANFTADGAVELYNNNVKRLATRSGGNSADGVIIHGNASNSSVNLYTESTIRGTLYANSSNLIGFLDNTGQWAFSVAAVGGNTISYNHFYPSSDNALDLGSNSKRWRNIYTTDLHCSNKGSSNDVDGTWGDYTIQEGESDLFLINNRSGKKYKFNLTEVS